MQSNSGVLGCCSLLFALSHVADSCVVIDGLLAFLMSDAVGLRPVHQPPRGGRGPSECSLNLRGLGANDAVDDRPVCEQCRTGPTEPWKPAHEDAGRQGFTEPRPSNVAWF